MDVLNAQEQWANMRRVDTDPRPRVKSGYSQLDSMLHRGSFAPGTFVLLAGRMHTRKTTVTVNLIRNMLEQQVPVLFVTLDEAPHMYTAKLASVITGVSHVDSAELAKREQEYRQAAAMLTMTKINRPAVDTLSGLLAATEVGGERARVVFIDYLSLLKRDKWGGDNTRIPRLCEDLQAWTNQQGVVTIALHQVGRQGDNQERVHGDKPVTPEQLMYGGEQQADIILATYRPALDPVGGMSAEEAQTSGIESAEWNERVNRSAKYENDTFLQLIKNRPGLHLDREGIRLQSIGDTQRMEEYA